MPILLPLNNYTYVHDVVWIIFHAGARRGVLRWQLHTSLNMFCISYCIFKIFSTDGGKIWQNQERLPVCSLRTLLSHYLDITTPASHALLALLAAHASAEEDKRRLQLLATVPTYRYILAIMHAPSGKWGAKEMQLLPFP